MSAECANCENSLLSFGGEMFCPVCRVREGLAKMDKKIQNLTEANNQIGRHSNIILAQRDSALARVAELEKLLDQNR